MIYARDLLDRTEKALSALRKEHDILFLSVEQRTYIEAEIKALRRSKAALSNYLVKIQQDNNK